MASEGFPFFQDPDISWERAFYQEGALELMDLLQCTNSCVQRQHDSYKLRASKIQNTWISSDTMAWNVWEDTWECVFHHLLSLLILVTHQWTNELSLPLIYQVTCLCFIIIINYYYLLGSPLEVPSYHSLLSCKFISWSSQGHQICNVLALKFYQYSPTTPMCKCVFRLLLVIN